MRRPDGTELHQLQPGEYALCTSNGEWYCRTPNGHGGNLSQHCVTVNADGTITVSPSILVSMRQDGQDVEVFHGFLENGRWRTV